MKILLINEKLIEGGAEQSSLKMKKLLEEKGHNVYYLTFDNNFEDKIKQIDNNFNIENIKVKNNIINKILFNPLLYLKIRKHIKKVNPDKIILNNIFSSPITQIKSLYGYEVYQIVRDYSIVCPKSTSIKNDFQICCGYKQSNCIKDCYYHSSKLQLKIKLYLTKKMERLRKKIIKKLISPSIALNNVLLNYGYNSVCINNPMDIPKQLLKGKEYDGNHRKYLYIGVINENKGVYQMLEAFKKFGKTKNVELKLIGKCTNTEDTKKLNEYIMNNEKIKYLGYKNHEDTIKELKQTDFIVVPSLWIENYPTTALEGMLYGAVVLGSNRGGIPEIVGENRGILFNILDMNDILRVLEESYNLNIIDYNEMRKKANDFVIENNSFERYYKQILRVIEG